MEEKRFLELALRARNGGATHFTRFLEPDEMQTAARTAEQTGVFCAFHGGHASAERNIVAFYADFPPESWPLRKIALSWNGKYANPGHRDILGAVLALGIARDTLGDIAVADGGAILCVHEDVAEYVLANLACAGRAKISATCAKDDAPFPEPAGVYLQKTVSAVRLDAVLAAAYGLSRAAAQNMVSAGGVKCNHALTLRGDMRLKAGDLLSVRGYGRVRLDEILGETKKGRRAIRLFRYGK